MPEEKLPTLDELNSSLPTLDDLNEGLKKKDETVPSQSAETTTEVQEPSYENVETPFGQLLEGLSDPFSKNGVKTEPKKERPQVYPLPTDSAPVITEAPSDFTLQNLEEVNKKNNAQLDFSKKRIQSNIEQLLATDEELTKKEEGGDIRNVIKESVLKEGATEWVANKTVEYYDKLKNDKDIIDSEVKEEPIPEEAQNVFDKITEMQNKEVLGEDFEVEPSEEFLSKDKVFNDYSNYLKTKDETKYANYIGGRFSEGDEKGYNFYLEALDHQNRLIEAKKERGLIDEDTFNKDKQGLNDRFVEVVREDSKFKNWSDSDFIGGFMDYSLDKERTEELQAQKDENYKQALIDVQDPSDPVKQGVAASYIAYHNVVLPAVIGVTKFGVGTIASAGRLTAAAKSDSESLVLNNVIDDFSHYFEKAEETMLPTTLKGEGITSSNIVPKSAEALSHLGILLYGGGVIGEGIEAIGLAQGAASKVGLFTSTFLSSQNDNYKAARETIKDDGTKLTHDEAMNFANTSAFTTSLIMLTNPRDYVYRRQVANNGVDAALKSVVKGADWKGALKTNMSFAWKEQQKGALLVANTTIADNVVKQTFNNVTGSQFVAETTPEQWEEAMIMGAIISAGASAKGFKSGNALRSESLYRAMQNMEAFNKSATKKVNTDQYTAEEIAQAKADVKEFKDIYDAIDPKYVDVYRMDLAADMLNKRRLEEKKAKIEKIDPVISEPAVEKINKEIEDINTEVKEKVKKPKVKKEPKAEAPKEEPKIDFGKVEEVEEAPTEKAPKKEIPFTAKEEVKKEVPSEKLARLEAEKKTEKEPIVEEEIIDTEADDLAAFEEAQTEAPKEEVKPKKGQVFVKEPSKVGSEKGVKSTFEYEDSFGVGYILKIRPPGGKQDRWIISSDKLGKLRGDESFTRKNQAIRFIREQATKPKEDAIQVRETKEIPVQPKAESGKEVLGRGKEEPKQAEGVVSTGKEVRKPKVSDKIVEENKKALERAEGDVENAEVRIEDAQSELDGLLKEKAKIFADKTLSPKDRREKRADIIGEIEDSKIALKEAKFDLASAKKDVKTAQRTVDKPKAITPKVAKKPKAPKKKAVAKKPKEEVVEEPVSKKMENLKEIVEDIETDIKVLAEEVRKGDGIYSKEQLRRKAELEEERDLTNMDILKLERKEARASEKAALEKALKTPKKTKADKKNALIEEVKALKNQPTTELYKKAKELGIERDPDMYELFKEKMKEYRDYQETLSEEQKLRREDIEIDPEGKLYQKESQQEKADRSYADAIAERLKKTFPNIEVIYNENIKGAGTISKEGKLIINPKKMGVDTQLHEVAEIWTSLLEKFNPTLFGKGINEAIKDKVAMAKMREERPDLKLDKDVAREIINEAIGIEAAEKYKSETKLGRWREKVWDAIRGFFGLKDVVSQRDIPTMKFEDFVKIAAKDILSEKPLSTVTEKQLSDIINGKLTHSDKIGIDSSILNGVSLVEGRGNIVQKAKMVTGNTLREFFNKSKNLPKNIARNIIEMKAEIEHLINRNAENKREFDKDIRKHITDAKLNKDQVTEMYHNMNRFLQGEATVDTLNIPDNLKMSLGGLRSSIQDFSVLIGKLGLSKRMKGIINENLGIYLHTSYEFHKFKPKSPNHWINKMIRLDTKNGTNVVETAYKEVEAQVEELINNVEDIIISKKDGRFFIKGKNKEILTEEEIDPLTGEVTVEGESIDRFTNEVEIDRDGLKALLETVREKYNKDLDVDKIIRYGGESSFGGGKDMFDSFGVNFETYKHAGRIINDLLQNNINDSEFLAFSNMNKKDVSILKNKKDLPQWYKDLLGEIKNPSLNYMESTSKMVNLLKYSELLSDIKTQTDGSLMFKNKSEAPSDFVRIKAEGNIKWTPLDGMYAHPEFKKALMDYENTDIFNIGKALQTNENIRFLSTVFDNSRMLWNVANATTKMNLTKYSIQGNVRNHFGAALMGARLGVNPMRFMYSYGKYWYGESERISKFAEKRKGLIGTRLSKSLKQYNKDLQKSYDEYRQLNLITSSVGFNTYKDAQKQAIKSSKQLSGMFGILAEVKAGSRDYNQFAKVSGKTLRARQGAIEFTDKFYQAPDAAIKVAAFEMTLNRFKKIYPELMVRDTKTGKMEASWELKLKTADHVLDRLPTAGRMPRISKALSKNPLFAPFSMFSTEMYRNNANQIRGDYSMYKEGLRTGNKHMVSFATRSFLNQIGATITVPTLSIIMAKQSGLDDKAMEQLKSTRAEWAKNSWMLYWGLGKGEVSAIDLTYSDPQAVISKTVAPFFNSDDDMMDKLIESVEEAAEPFSGKEVLFGKLLALNENRNEWGMPIFGDEETTSARNLKRLEYLGPALLPAAWYQTQRAIDIYNEENESAEWGDKSDFKTVLLNYGTGIKIKRTDVKKQVGYLIRKYKERYNEQGQLARGTGVYKESADPEQATKRRRELYERLRLNVGALRTLGATESEIKETLGGQYGLTKSFVYQIMNGIFIPVPTTKEKVKFKKEKGGDSFGGEVEFDEGGGFDDSGGGFQ